jgi:NCAIR mutase (PurE)-related protein
MWDEQINDILNQVSQGALDPSSAQKKVRELISLELGVAEIDTSRHIRTGFPEVVFCLNKTDDDILSIVRGVTGFHETILLTRAKASTFDLLSQHYPDLIYYEKSGAIIIGRLKEGKGKVSIISAGTSDIPIAEEAFATARVMGASVETYWDIGVAGLHRLFSKIKDLRSSRVIIAVAGMDGALPGVVAGLVNCPVVAVPTSVGYGASFGGIAGLLTMLNSCAPGVAVVNIDNGFGAGYIAALINKRGEEL